MALKKEIERKYLIRREKLPELSPGARLAQAYLASQPTVRVRTEESPDGSRAGWLTIKGAGLVGRDEWEYAIPYEEARAMFALATTSPVTKTRHTLPVEGEPELKWEIDVFDGDNEGLIVAELEVPEEGHAYACPDWIGEDVTEDPAYKNSALALRPYRTWSQ